MSATGKHPLSRFFSAATRIEAGEMRAVLLAFGFIFTLMLAYNIMKPVRDALAPTWSDVELASLWTINFVFSAIAVSVYGWAVSRAKLRNVVPGVYILFAASFVLFYLAARASTDGDFVNKAFYVWLSLFALFHVSVFWSLMADVFTKQQAPRLFAFIASGASIGTIAGASLTLLLAERLGVLNLMLVAAGLLVMTLPMIALLRADAAASGAHADDNVSIRGNPFSGFKSFISNPYLLGIAVFIFLYTFIGSFAYFEIKNLMDGNDRDSNTAIWAGINLTVNGISIAVAWFVSGRLTVAVGLGKALAMVPLLVAVGFMAVFGNPSLAIIIVTWVVLKAGNYSITRPGREMLYTNVSREDRFKTKQVIDIVVYRGSDVFAGWVFALLTTTIGFGMGPMALIGAAVAVAWAFVGLRLGNAYDGKVDDAAESVT